MVQYNCLSSNSMKDSPHPLRESSFFFLEVAYSLLSTPFPSPSKCETSRFPVPLGIDEPPSSHTSPFFFLSSWSLYPLPPQIKYMQYFWSATCLLLDLFRRFSRPKQKRSKVGKVSFRTLPLTEPPSCLEIEAHLGYESAEHSPL